MTIRITPTLIVIFIVIFFCSADFRMLREYISMKNYTTGSYKNMWRVYIDSTLHSLLPKLKMTKLNCIHTLFQLYTRSNQFYKIARQSIFEKISISDNFNDYKIDLINKGKYLVKTIIGRIMCCHIQQSYFFQHFKWELVVDVRFHINATVLCLDLSMYRREWWYHLKSKSDAERLIIKYYRMKAHQQSAVLLGRRNTITFLSADNKLYVHSYTYNFIKQKFDIAFSMIDSIILHRFKFIIIGRGQRLYLNANIYFTLLCSQTEMRSYLITMSKLYPIAVRLLKQKREVYKVNLYDGPDTTSKRFQSYQPEKFIKMSTFQCYIEMHVKSFGVFILAFRVPIADVVSLKNDTKVDKHYLITKHVLLSQDMCKDLNYCIFNVSAPLHGSYLNVSLVSMNFVGPTTECLFGGLSYYGYDSVYKKTLCDLYKRTVHTESIEKVPMDIVTPGFSCLIVIYGYHPHNVGMEFLLNVSVTPCKGLFPCDGGKTKLLCFHLNIRDSNFYCFTILANLK